MCTIISTAARAEESYYNSVVTVDAASIYGSAATSLGQLYVWLYAKEIVRTSFHQRGQPVAKIAATCAAGGSASG